MTQLNRHLKKVHCEFLHICNSMSITSRWYCTQ